jgi:hypothetical protein
MTTDETPRYTLEEIRDRLIALAVAELEAAQTLPRFEPRTHEQAVQRAIHKAYWRDCNTAAAMIQFLIRADTQGE